MTAKINISGKKLQGTDNTRLEYSTNFFAVLFKIKQLNCVTAGISELSEVPIQEPGDVDYYLKDNDSDWGGGEEKMSSKGMGTNLIVSQMDQFQMTPDVHGYVNITKVENCNQFNNISLVNCNFGNNKFWPRHRLIKPIFELLFLPQHF